MLTISFCLTEIKIKHEPSLGNRTFVDINSPATNIRTRGLKISSRSSCCVVPSESMFNLDSLNLCNELNNLALQYTLKLRSM